MKLVNPIHFFDHRGHSILSADFLADENQKLRNEISDLQRKNRALALRLRYMAGDTENSISGNH